MSSTYPVMATPAPSFFVPAGTPGDSAQPRAALLPGSSDPWVIAAPLDSGGLPASQVSPAAASSSPAAGLAAPPMAGSSSSSWHPAAGSTSPGCPMAGCSPPPAGRVAPTLAGPSPGFQRWAGLVYHRRPQPPPPDLAVLAPVPPVRLTYSRRP